MQITRTSKLTEIAVTLIAATLLSSSALAVTEKVLHTFNSTDGGQTIAKLVFDSKGNLYGTTPVGGKGFGVVYKLSPNSIGGFTRTIIHNFSGGRDGANPQAGLIFDAAGNLYGTAAAGGVHGDGVVLELKSNGTGGWTETVLWPFTGGVDEGSPNNALVLDSVTGSLFGTTDGIDSTQFGTLFRLSPKLTGGFSMRVLHTFTNGTDGAAPTAIVRDASGNILGTTFEGGGTSCSMAVLL
jgi:hypothetical protein